MRLKEEENKVIITVKDRSKNKSKSITVYDCTVDEMIKAIKTIVEKNAT